MGRGRLSLILPFTPHSCSSLSDTYGSASFHVQKEKKNRSVFKDFTTKMVGGRLVWGVVC